MSPSFLVKILCYTWRPFTITLASSAIICAGLCLILKRYQSVERVDVQHYPSTRSTDCYNHFRIRQETAQIIADDARVMVKGLHA